MKSKNKKGPTTPRTSEEDLTLPKSNAFTFLKNRFFQQQQQQQQQQNEKLTTHNHSSSSSGSSPRLSTSSTRSVAANSKPWSIDNNNSNNITIEKPISRSFDENSISDVVTSKVISNRNPRPVSMMGLEGFSLLQQQQSELTTLPETIEVAKPNKSYSTEDDALTLVIPRTKSISAAEKRTSLIIIKEGYLYKKTDFKPFHKQTKLERGWKLYKIILRGHKLYLYKLTTESPLKSLFPSQQHHHQLSYSASSNSLLSTSSMIQNNTTNNHGLSLSQNDFDLDTQKVLFSPTNHVQGLVFMELNQVTMQQKNQVYLILSSSDLYICSKSSSNYKLDTRIPLSQLKIELLQHQQSDELVTSPTTSISSDPFSTTTKNNHNSGGLLLFSISYINRPSILGVYSTQHREDGFHWIQLFTNTSKTVIENGEDLSSSRSGGESLWRVNDEDCWDDTTTSRMYDATQRYHPDLIRNDRSVIEGGTINALIHELLFNTENNDELLNVFLLLYSNFTTGARVLSQFSLILSKNPSLESRLFDIFTLWCQRYSLDIIGDVVSGMVSILEGDTIVDKERANEIKELVLNTVTKNGKKNCENNNSGNIMNAEDEFYLSNNNNEEEEDTLEDSQEVENISAHEIDGKRRDSINLSNLLITGLTPDVFLNIDPKSFAQQIYLFHYAKHHQFYQDLLNPLSYLPGRPQISVQMLNSLLFTTVSPHFLTKLIRNQVLIDTQQQQQLWEDTTIIRSKLLEHWIHIGIHLLELGDMIGWCAIAMGICSVGIVRLRETWKAVDRDLVDRVQTDWVKVLTDHGLYNQNVWAQGWENNKTEVLDIADVSFRDIQMCPPNTSLPFFGTIRQTVDRLRKHIKMLIVPNIVNMVECQRIYDTIISSLEHWKRNHSNSEKNSIVDSLPFVGPLQSFFEHSVTDLMSVPHDFKYLQECSLACEPRIFGQGYDRRKFTGKKTQANAATDVAPPSTASLLFPKILDGCSLLDVEHVSSTSSQSPSGLGATHSSLSISSQSTSNKKSTHPRKMGTHNSIRSIRSFLEDGSISSNTKKQSNLTNMASASTSNGSINNNTTTTTTTINYDIVSPSRGANRKAFRRRTYSFPPGSGNAHPSSTASKLDLLESENNRTWLGSLISNRHHRTYSTKALIEAHRKSRAAQYGHNGEIILSVQQGELIFKAAAILKKDSANGEESGGAIKKVESVHSIDFLKKDDIDDDEDTLLVSVKAGYLDHLVDCLVRGVLPHEEALKDQWQMMSLAEGLQHQVQPGRVAMDEEEYINVFFMTFRIYCSTNHLFDLLRKKYLDAKSKCKIGLKKRKNSLILLETYFTPTESAKDQQQQQQQQITVPEIDSYDWKKVADIQLRVLNLFIYWIEEHPYDFIDEVETSRYMDHFLTNAKKSLDEWRVPLSEHEEKNASHEEALLMAHTIEQKMMDLRTLFIRKNLSPCYDMKSIPFDPESTRGVEELYRQLTNGTQKYHTTLQLATNKLIPLSISTRPHDADAKSLVDCFAPEALLEQVDKAVRQLFSAVTMQDWIQTFDVFEAQSNDLYAWLPARKPSRTSRMSASLSPVEDAPSSHLPNYHVLSDEVIVSDIFTAIEGARRSVVSPSAFSDDDLLLAFPGSIQYLYCMHFIIRSWVMNEIAATDIDPKTRVLRIEKFLQLVLMSKISSEKMTLFPELKEASSSGRVPGFVEYAIASALVSPEVRIFTKAWSDVAMQHGHANLDTLENLLNQIQKTQPVVSSRTMTASYSSTSIASCYQQLVVPSLGWIFERIMELCFHIPDTFDKKDNIINFDKRRCVYQFLQLIMNVQVDLDEQQVEAKGISMSFLISPCASPKESWKTLREVAARENKKTTSTSSMVLRGPSSKSQLSKSVFNKLVGEQLDKLKRDFKERDRIDKEWLSLQHKLQKKQLEQARQVEKLDRKAINKSSTHMQLQQHSVMPRINSFLRGLRPNSIVAAPIQHIFPGSIDYAHQQTQHQNHPYATKASTVINLIHSTTSVASTYTKRDFVFRIVTEEGGQYLFQAMNREDMQDWMQHVNNSAREGAAKRQSVLAAESLDFEGGGSHRQNAAMLGGNNRNQTASRTSVYGVSLDTLMHNHQIPLVVEKCIGEIERRGLEEVGIYRVAGTGSVVSALKAEFNKDVQNVDMTSPRWADINVVADAFKQFLRELPEPLLTYTYYDEFIKASASEDHDERVYLIKKVIKKLPYSNYLLLKRIIEHFVTVTDFEATNHMYATNLAIVFGPTLLQPTPGPASFATTMSNLGHHQNIVKYLILNYHYLFDVESDEVECKVELQEKPQAEQEETIAN